MDPVAEYNRMVADDGAAAVEQAAWLAGAFARAGITFDGQPMRSFIRPHFLPRSEWDLLRDAGRRLLELAVRVARQVFDGDAGRLCAYLGTPEAEARWVVLDPGEPDVLLSRLDAFLTPQGPRFLEINSDAPAGFGYGDRMAEVFGDLPLFRRFAQRFPVSYEPSGPRLVQAVLAAGRARGATSGAAVAIADWAEVKTRPDQEILRQAFEAAGVRCILADPRQMQVRDGRLWSGSTAVEIVYRRAVLSELVARESEVRSFLAAYRDRVAVFVNSFRCHLSEDKAFFALLTDEIFSAIMSEDERALVARIVPWTRKVEERSTRRRGREIDFLPHILAHKDELVLKPAHGYGGASVLIGDETEAGAWERAITDALGKPWVVQERVPIPEEPFPVCEGGHLAFESLKLNANPFYVAGAEVGAVTRASRSSVINVSAGGGSVPAFVVG